MRSVYLKSVLLLLLLILPLSSSSAQAFDDSDRPKQSTPAETQQAPDRELENAETASENPSDAALFTGDDEFEGFSDDLELRRLRLYTRGRFFLWVPIYYKFQFGITTDAFHLNDGYLQLRNIPWIQAVTLGYLKAPFSLDRLTGSSNITFMERASPVDAFAPGFKAGVKGSGNEFGNRMSWSLGWFADGQKADIGDVTDSNIRIVGRVTGLPFYIKDLNNSRLMHLGLSYSYVNAAGNTVRYRSRPESHIAPYVVDTGEIPAGNADLLGAEVAFVMNALSAQVEYIHSFVDAEEGEDLQFKGYYAYLSFFSLERLGCMTRPRESSPGCGPKRTSLSGTTRVGALKSRPGIPIWI